MILMNNSNDYIKRQTSVLKRKGKEISYKNYGSPISISANTLKYNSGELKCVADH